MKFFLVLFAILSFTILNAYEGSVLSDRVAYNLVEGLPNIYITPFSEKIGHTWDNGSVWDKELIKKFYTLLKTRDDFFVVLDIGAQTGCFSLLANFFPNSKWYAFEPIKEAADSLQDNLILNEISNVKVYGMAVSDEAGRKTLNMPAMNAWGLATLGSNCIRFNPVGERTVECIDLDTFVEAYKIEKINFIKIDVEGWELNVLKGAKNLIIRDKPSILMEYNETNMQQCNVKKEEIHNFLSSIGYEWHLVSSEDILCSPKE